MQLGSQIPLKPELMAKLQELVDREVIKEAIDLLGAEIVSIVTPKRSKIYFQNGEIVAAKANKPKAQ